MYHKTIRPIAIGLLLTAIGCNTLNSGQPLAERHAGVGVEAQQASAVQEDGPSYKVELRAKGKKQRGQLPLEEGQVVQDALEKSGAIGMFRRMDIYVWRKPPGSQRRVTLEVKYDHIKRRVDPVFDYALHPDDLVVIIEDNTNQLDEVVDGMFKPLNQALGGGSRR